MIGNDHVHGINVPVTNYRALATILDFIERTVGDENGRIRLVGMQHKTPFYQYYRETQVAQSLGARPIMSARIGRLRGMRYKDNKPWGIQVADMQLVYANTQDPNHFVRQTISLSLARALLDDCLKDVHKIQDFMKDHPEIEDEVMTLYHQEEETRKTKAEEHIRAARRARRGY